MRNRCLITILKKYIRSHLRCRSSHWRCSVKKGVLKNFANSTEKHLGWSLLQAFSLQVFFKRRLQHKYFPVKFAKLLRAPILKNICKRLHLEVSYKKAVLKSFAILTGRKQLLISSVKKVLLVVDRAVKVTFFILINVSLKNV